MSRVFVVDDEPDVVDLLRTLLIHEGFEVDLAIDGQSALAGIFGNPPDLAIIDLMMPDMDGFELLRILRSDPRTKGVPILVLSARTAAHDQLETLQLGANAYVFKPFSPGELVRQIEQILGSDGVVRDG